ncbi:MAG TPA: hypothetical protein VFX02_07225 [Gammaproteobacteria bacterium]|nr:hypothetical protein [Gammaproteobacteria bacterium]
MKSFIKLMVVALVLISFPCQALTPLEWCFAYIVAVKTNPNPIKAVNGAANEDTISQEFLDIAAEATWERANDPNIDVETKKSLWLLVQDLGGPRYRKVLVKTAEATKDGVARTVAKNIRRKRLDLNSPDLYQPGTVSLNAMRQRYIEDARNARVPDAAARPLLKVKPGQKLEDVLSIMGYPQAVDTSGIYQWSHISLLYRGQGAIVLRPDRNLKSVKGDPLWVVGKVVEDPLTQELDMPYIVLAEGGSDIVTNLHFNVFLYGNNVGAKRLAQRLYHSTSPVDSNLLDVAALYLENKYKAATETWEVDALSWICRLLRSKGAGRYETLLKTVNRDAQSLKLRSYAGLKLNRKGGALGKLPTQYVASMVDVGSLQKKYPPLYGVSKSTEEATEMPEDDELPAAEETPEGNASPATE